MDMTKYLKITGVGGATTTVIPCNDLYEITVDTVGSLTAVDLKYFDTDVDASAIVIQTAATTTAKLVEQANFLADKIVEALQLSYDEPMLEIPADGFPLPLTSITIT
tara:strand:- start:119 stop:439 length:321 start_codon:yes stop_codon:yes gene_type:complete